MIKLSAVIEEDGMSQIGLKEYLEVLKKERPTEILEYNDSAPLDYFMTSLVLELDKRDEYPWSY
jgi:hypothetical protein